MLTTLGVGLPGTLMMITKMISVIMINVWSHDDDHHCYHAQQMSGRPTLVLIWEPGANHQQPFGSSQEHGLRERGWTKKTLLLQAGAHVEAKTTIQRLFRSFLCCLHLGACLQQNSHDYAYCRRRGRMACGCTFCYCVVCAMSHQSQRWFCGSDTYGYSALGIWMSCFVRVIHTSSESQHIFAVLFTRCV